MLLFTGRRCKLTSRSRLFPSLQTQLQAATQPQHLAFAVSMFSFFRGLGQTLGIAIGGNIFQR
jgi:hypothetical protein